MIIAIDFDGTCVTHEYPHIGKDIGVVPILKKLIKAGHNLILYTMRCDLPLQEAIEWFAKNDIPLYAIQKDVNQGSWTTSNKCYAHLYIDDAALGCPLVTDHEQVRPYADWFGIDMLLTYKGFYQTLAEPKLVSEANKPGGAQNNNTFTTHEHKSGGT